MSFSRPGFVLLLVQCVSVLPSTCSDSHGTSFLRGAKKEVPGYGPIRIGCLSSGLDRKHHSTGHTDTSQPVVRIHLSINSSTLYSGEATSSRRMRIILG